MKIKIIQHGKTFQDFINTGVQLFEKRLSHYVKFEVIELPEVKKQKNPRLQKEEEAKMLLNKLETSDWVVLLDEKGKQKSSVEWAKYLEHKQVTGCQSLVVVIGGAYGFDEKVYQRANEKLSLSAMTFSHQMVRLFFTEQLYRAFTIIKGEKYHNE